MHAHKIGPGQWSRFLVLTKRSADSADENVENTKRLLCAWSGNWIFREVAIRGADQKKRGLWEGRVRINHDATPPQLAGLKLL